jgi:hypothetical protein
MYGPPLCVKQKLEIIGVACKIRGRDDEAAKRWEEFQQQNSGSQREPHQVA